jgi:hypothetical protein
MSNGIALACLTYDVVVSSIGGLTHYSSPGVNEFLVIDHIDKRLTKNIAKTSQLIVVTARIDFTVPSRRFRNL